MIVRETMIEQSVQDFVSDGLVAAGYEAEDVHVRDAFPTTDERSSELSRTEVACGFNFDDGGTPMEMGSNLTRRVYTIEFFVFGTTAQWATNVATVIRTLLEDAGLIPLKNVGVAGQPVIDQLVLLDDRGIPVERQQANDPRPWDRYVWKTTAKIEDTYYPALVD